MHSKICEAAACVLVFLLLCSSAGAVGAFRYRMETVNSASACSKNVVGFIESHAVKKNETLLDIAREYGLGFNELKCLYPELDPWVPPEGTKIDIPLMWVLPSTRFEEVVVNIAEMRLYRFFPKYKMVKTYPVGTARKGFETPVSETRVAERILHPHWTAPPGIRCGSGRESVPPGPENPLGDYWIGLKGCRIGIHSTNNPWGVGRRVSHGCFRMYPEHMKEFFKEVSVGTRVEIIYEPVKAGTRDNRIFIEVHPDVNEKIPDMPGHARDLLEEKGLLPWVDNCRLHRAVSEKNGVPVLVGIVGKQGPKTRKGGIQ